MEHGHELETINKKFIRNAGINYVISESENRQSIRSSSYSK